MGEKKRYIISKHDLHYFYFNPCVILLFLEIGRYLALDLGGTNFRVLSVTLERNRKITTEKETYEFPMEKKVGPGEEVRLTE